ncbi:MAG: hypothetical protein OXH94_15250 [Rhodospirillales bacterium]|nr:hypothetical protein [Rhodospirillales bacterium]
MKYRQHVDAESDIADLEFVEKHTGAIDHWWQSEDVQKARREWCSGNAMTGKSWLATWVRVLATVS